MAVKMQVIVYGFCQCSTDTSNFDQIIDARAYHTLQSAKLPQQLAALLGTEPRYLFESRCRASFRASLTMTRYREAMRFVTN